MSLYFLFVSLCWSTYLAMMKFHWQHTSQKHRKYISPSLIDQFIGFNEDSGECFFFFILHYKQWGCWCTRKNVLSKSTYCTYPASFDSLARLYHFHSVEDYFLVTEAASFKSHLFRVLLGTCKRKSPSQSEYMKAHWTHLRELHCSLTDRQIYSPQHFARPHPGWKNIQSQGPALLTTLGKAKLKKAITQSEYCNIQ